MRIPSELAVQSLHGRITQADYLLEETQQFLLLNCRRIDSSAPGLLPFDNCFSKTVLKLFTLFFVLFHLCRKAYCILGDSLNPHMQLQRHSFWVDGGFLLVFPHITDFALFTNPSTEPIPLVCSNLRAFLDDVKTLL